VWTLKKKLWSPDPQRDPSSSLQRPTQAKESAKEQPVGLQLAEAIDSGYGIRFMIVNLEGAQVEAFFYSIIHISTMNSDTFMSLGLAFCGLFAAYYIAYTAIVWRLCSSIWTSVRLRSQEQVPGMDREPLASAVDLKRGRLGVFGAVVASFRVPSSLLQLRLPTVFTARCLLLCLSSVLLVASGNLQMSFTLVIETVYLFLIVKSNVKASRLEHYLDICSTSMNLLYVSVVMVAAADFSVRTRQQVIGIIAVVPLAVGTLANGLFVVYSMVCIMIEAVRTARRWCSKNQKLSQVASGSLHGKAVKVPRSSHQVSKQQLKTKETFGRKKVSNFRKSRLFVPIPSNHHNQPDLLSKTTINSRRLEEAPYATLTRNTSTFLTHNDTPKDAEPKTSTTVSRLSKYARKPQQALLKVKL